MIDLRAMTADDIPLGMRLKNQAGWNQTEADWRRFLSLEPDGCFVAEHQGQAVGTVATFLFDRVAWIAMVLVDAAVRHQGIGSRLVEHALEHLRRRGAVTVRLDATSLGRPVYEKLGFVPEYELIRFEAAHLDAPLNDALQPLDTARWDAVAALDRSVTGTCRRRLLTALHADHPAGARIVEAGGQLCGYGMVRPGSRAWQIGPAVALDPATGVALFEAGFAQCSGRPVFVDIPCDNRPAVDRAIEHGLVEQRSFVRMVLGEPVDDRPAQIWASSGPEKG